ncbi:MAG: helix-turn-helix domain-containing protein [Bacillota bacterium]
MLNERLIKLRTEQNKTQKQVAADLNLNYQRYNHYETGKRQPDNETLQKLADYFDTTTDYLLGRSDRRHRIVTVAAHTDDQEGLPPEAQEEILEYIEFIRQKYRKKK